MNIFVLDYNHKKNAEYHVNCHTYKMLVESAQLLCSAYYFTNQEHLSPYKLTHKMHPCSVWTRSSLSNWIWLRDLGIALYEEYKYRYGDKNHKSGDIILGFEIPNLPDIGLTSFTLAMPDKYKNKCAVKSYRDYYIEEKQHLLKYKRRGFPEWLIVK